MDVHARLRHSFIPGSITNILLQYIPQNVHSVSSFLVCFAVFSFQLYVDSRELFIHILQDCFTGTWGSWFDGPHPQFGVWYTCDGLNVMTCNEINFIIIWQLTPKVFNHTCIVFISPLKTVVLCGCNVRLSVPLSEWHSTSNISFTTIGTA